MVSRHYGEENMPSDFECPNCHLGFSVGWYHYHRSDSGYIARTLLVCSVCGVQHSIEHPIQKKNEEPKPLVLESFNEPMINVQRVSGTKLLSPGKEWQNRTSIESQKVKDLSCQHCANKGMLVAEWPLFGASCPKCGTKIQKALTSWRT
jgi:RNase P subunit RPR2